MEQSKELFWPLMIIPLQHQEMAVFVLGQKWGKHQVVFSGDNLWHLYMWVSLSCAAWLGTCEHMTVNVCLCSTVFRKQPTQNVDVCAKCCICTFVLLCMCVNLLDVHGCACECQLIRVWARPGFYQPRGPNHVPKPFSRGPR